MQLVLNTMGLGLKVRNKIFRVSGGEEVRDISPELISSIAVTSPCVISSAAIALAADAEIPIYIFDRYGDARACLRSPYFESLATLRRKQVYFSDSKAGAAWVVRQFERKTSEQIGVMKYVHRRKRTLRETISELETHFTEQVRTLEKRIDRPTSTWSATVMGWEGQMARRYWQFVAQAMPEEWHFENRSRRPARDPFNAAINYFYGMLYALVEQALFGAGLDPHLGILHVDEYDRPTLSFDLIEGFRPWVDLFVVKFILEKRMEQDWFEEEKEAWLVGSRGKKQLIPAFNAWMQAPVRWEGRQMKRISHIYRAAAELAKLIDTTTTRPD